MWVCHGRRRAAGNNGRLLQAPCFVDVLIRKLAMCTMAALGWVGPLGTNELYMKARSIGNPWEPHRI